MKKSVLFSALALTASIFADGDAIAAQMKSDQSQQMMDQQKKPMMVNLTSARPESDNGWYIFADALYWHADVGSTEWAWKIDDVAATVSTGDLHSLDFKWSWGFRVGAGVNMDHDMWDSNLYYTWFHTQNSNTAGVGPAGQVQDIIGNGFDGFDNFTTGKVDWTVHFSMFDWELGRWYYVSKNLAVRPHVGVKGGWIHQHVDYRLTDASSPSAVFNGNYDLHNDFWGVGPSGGVNMMWILGNAGVRMNHRFCLFGDFGGAIMYGHFDVDHKEHIFNAAGVLVGGNHPTGLDRNLAVTMLQTMMGFSWDTGFNRDRNHFTFKVGYEFQYWFRQHQMLRGVESGNSFGYHRVSDDLALQGLTVDFRFDF